MYVATVARIYCVLRIAMYDYADDKIISTYHYCKLYIVFMRMCSYPCKEVHIAADFSIGLAAILVQIPLIDPFRWSGWYLAFHGMIQMLVVLVIFKENWSDLKRASINCQQLSILSGIAVPFYVSF